MSSPPQTLNIVQYNVHKSRNRVMSVFFRHVTPGYITSSRYSIGQLLRCIDQCRASYENSRRGRVSDLARES